MNEIINTTNKKSDLKELLINRILELKKLFQNFSTSSMRWKNFKINNTHISNIDFNSLSEEELLNSFELIIRKCSKMM